MYNSPENFQSYSQLLKFCDGEGFFKHYFVRSSCEMKITRWKAVSNISILFSSFIASVSCFSVDDKCLSLYSYFPYTSVTQIKKSILRYCSAHHHHFRPETWNIITNGWRFFFSLPFLRNTLETGPFLVPFLSSNTPVYKYFESEIPRIVSESVPMLCHHFGNVPPRFCPHRCPPEQIQTKNIRPFHSVWTSVVKFRQVSSLQPASAA